MSDYEELKIKQYLHKFKMIFNDKMSKYSQNVEIEKIELTQTDNLTKINV